MNKVLKTLLFLLLAFTLFVNCRKADEPATMQPIAKKIKILALGDSYTKGEGVATAVSFPYLLKDRLEATGELGVEKLQVIAQTGWTTTSLINAIKNAAITDTFDLVTLLIGVNNQYQRKPMALYQSEFPQLLQTAIAFAGGDKNKVAVISIPDYGATPIGEGDAERIGKEIDEYNAVNKHFADSLRVTYFDITPISRLAKGDASLVAYDELHPSGKMYALWIDLMFEGIRAKL